MAYIHYDKKSNGVIYASLYESFRDKGRVKTKRIENLGRVMDKENNIFCQKDWHPIKRRSRRRPREIWTASCRKNMPTAMGRGSYSSRKFLSMYAAMRHMFIFALMRICILCNIRKQS